MVYGVSSCLPTYINFVFINYYLLSLLTFCCVSKMIQYANYLFPFHVVFHHYLYLTHYVFTYPIVSFLHCYFIPIYTVFFSSFPCYTYKYSSSTNLASLAYAVVWLLILVPCVLQIRQEVLLFYFCLISSVDVPIPYLTLITLLESRYRFTFLFFGRIEHITVHGYFLQSFHFHKFMCQ